MVSRDLICQSLQLLLLVEPQLVWLRGHRGSGQAQVLSQTGDLPGAFCNLGLRELHLLHRLTNVLLVACLRVKEQSPRLLRTFGLLIKAESPVFYVRWALKESNHVGQNSVDSGSACVLISNADDSSPFLMLQLLLVLGTRFLSDDYPERRFLVLSVGQLLDLTLDLIPNMLRAPKGVWALNLLFGLLLVLGLLRALALASGAMVVAVLLVHGAVGLLPS